MESDAAYPGAPDAMRCGAARCVDGACVVEIAVGPLASKIRGDCEQDECTKDGRVVSVAAYDVYNDGNECTNDLCDSDMPVNAQLAGVLCPVSGAGDAMTRSVSSVSTAIQRCRVPMASCATTRCACETTA